MSDYPGLTVEDIDYARAILKAFYDESLASRVNINENVVGVIAEMLDQAADCTEWMGYVPKPVSPIGVRPGIQWALKQLRRVGSQLARNPSSRIAFLCKKNIALKFRSELEYASY